VSAYPQKYLPIWFLFDITAPLAPGDSGLLRGTPYRQTGWLAEMLANG